MKTQKTPRNKGNIDAFNKKQEFLNSKIFDQV